MARRYRSGSNISSGSVKSRNSVRAAWPAEVCAATTASIKAGLHWGQTQIEKVSVSSGYIHINMKGNETLSRTKETIFKGFFKTNQNCGK